MAVSEGAEELELVEEDLKEAAVEDHDWRASLLETLEL